MTTIKEIVERSCAMVNIAKERETLRSYTKEGLPKGVSTGWFGFDEYLKIMKGQLNVISGVPGAGKSEFLEALAVNLSKDHGWNVFLYSPENFPTAYHMMKFAEKITGKPFEARGNVAPMTEEELDNAEHFIKSHFEFVNPGTEPYDIDQIFFTLEKNILLRKRIDMVIIDPWNEMEQFRKRNQTETEYIGEKLMWTRRFARKHNISWWYVVHPAKMERKKDGVFPEPSMYDLSGSQHWFNKTDNGIILHRTDEDKMNNLIVKAKVTKVKNRFCGKCGEHFFQFNPIDGSFSDYYPYKNSDLAF